MFLQAFICNIQLDNTATEVHKTYMYKMKEKLYLI